MHINSNIVCIRTQRAMEIIPISTRSKSNHTKIRIIRTKNLKIAIDILIYFTDTPHSTFFSSFHVPDVVYFLSDHNNYNNYNTRHEIKWEIEIIKFKKMLNLTINRIIIILFSCNNDEGVTLQC